VIADLAVLTLALATSTGAVYAVGGAPHTAVHLFYFPIIYAAARFGGRAGALTAVIAGLLTGPLMPQDVTTGAQQPAGTWLLRLVLFVAISAVVQWLAHQEPRPVHVMLRDVVWGRSLRLAVRRRQVTAHYQPIVDLGTGSTIGVEALCRWPDGHGGFHSPGDFIPAAERNGSIGSLGRAMLTRTAAQAAAWSADLLTSRMVTVNISAVQLTNREFLADLSALLVGHRLPADLYCLEITETALISDPVRALGTLRAAKAMGFKVAIDDFGTGHSSLAYLKDFPIDYIKIDRSFVAEVDRDPRVNSLTMAIIEMAKALGATTIAEGIERESQLESLRALGCHLGQGWLLGRPVPADQVPARTRGLPAASATPDTVVPRQTRGQPG